MDRIQWVSILGSAALLGVVLELVRSRRLRERYSLLWIVTGVILLVLSCWRGVLDRLAGVFGIHYPPSALFLVGFGFFLVILLHFSIVHSMLAVRVKELAQEIALLKDERRHPPESPGR
ncbi:MAG TPA: DUF2304 domain-containing protein [bacterium]|nr:DUF2304 domain-containing protein [bacterium]